MQFDDLMYHIVIDKVPKTIKEPNGTEHCTKCGRTFFSVDTIINSLNKKENYYFWLGEESDRIKESNP